MLVQNFLFGLCMYTQQYMLPLYYQNVRRMTPLHSAMMMLPMTLVQAIFSVNSGQYISWRKRYGEVIWTGFAFFALGTCLCTLFERTTPLWEIGLILGVLGLGNGNIFQPTLVALQAHCTKSQRAVVISVRNFLRCLGGAVGLAVSSAILQNVLKRELPGQFSYLAASTYAKPDYSSFRESDALLINDAYAKASHTVWIFMAPVAGLAFVLCVFVRDRGLTRPDELPEGHEKSEDVEQTSPENEDMVEVDEKARGVGSSMQSVSKDDIASKSDIDVVLDSNFKEP
jgi:MFS family permease